MSFSKKYWKPVMVLLALLLLAGMARLWFGKREPVYQGRTFNSWFYQAYLHADPGRSGIPPQNELEAETAIRAMGAAAVPLLLEQLRARDTRWTDLYRQTYHKLPNRIQRYLPRPNLPRVRQLTALNFLLGLGPVVRPFVPQIITIFNRDYIRLHQLPPDAKINWTEQFAHPESRITRSNDTFWVPVQMLKIITSVGGDDPEIVPLILSSYSQDLPVWLPQDYTNMAGAIKLSEPFLLTNVSHPDPAVRGAVIGMLGTLAPDEPELAPVFLKATSDPEISVRRNALLGLGKTRPEFEPTLPVLARLLEETNQFITEPARQTFLALGGGLKMFGRLNHALASTNADVRAAAARLLRDYPRRAEIAKDRLRELTNAAVEPDEAVRREALATLERMARSESPTNQNFSPIKPVF